MSGYSVGWCVDAAGHWAWWYARLVDRWKPIEGCGGSICCEDGNTSLELLAWHSGHEWKDTA